MCTQNQSSQLFKKFFLCLSPEDNFKTISRINFIFQTKGYFHFCRLSSFSSSSPYLSLISFELKIIKPKDFKFFHFPTHSTYVGEYFNSAHIQVMRMFLHD